MKKKMILVLISGVLLFFLYFFGIGFTRNPSAYIRSYELSDDGREMTIQVGISTSAGYVRKVQVYQQQGGRLYLDCYRAFGGVNGSIGAKSTYIIPLDENTETIALYRNVNAYQEVLKKDSNGQWQEVRQNPVVDY